MMVSRKMYKTAFITLLAYSGITQAQIIQYFGFQTDNPAALQFVENNELVMGGTFIFPRVEQTGTVFGVSGSSSMEKDTQFGFPEFRYAHRFSSKLVAGLDVSEPVMSVYPWKQNSFTSPAGYGVNIDSLSFVPKISYAVTDNLTFGIAGAATHIYDFTLNANNAPAGYFQNESDGWAYSYQLGAMYKINPQTFIDFTYLSEIKTETSGDSTFGGMYSNNYKTNDFIWAPNTYALRLTRFMTPKWLAVAEVDYSEWSDEKELDLKNNATGGPATFPFSWDNTTRFALFNRYQITDKMGGFLSLAYETSAEDKASENYTVFPTGKLATVVLGGDYKLTSNMKVAMFVGNLFWPSDIHNTAPAGADVTTSGNYYFAGGNVTFDW